MQALIHVNVSQSQWKMLMKTEVNKKISEIIENY